MIYKDVNVNMVSNGYFQVRDGGKATAFNREPKREQREREYLNRSRPGVSGTEKALLDTLWNQVAGKQGQALESKFYPSINDKVTELNALLFTQIANHHGHHG